MLITAGGSFSQEDTIAPSPPSNLVLIEKTTGTVTLSWSPSTDNQPGPISYDVYFNNYPQMNNITDTTVRVTELTPGESYTIYLFALDSSINISEPSETLFVTLDSDTDTPLPPSNLRVIDSTPGTITVGWSRAVDDGAIAQYIIGLDSKDFIAHTEDTSITIWHLDPKTSYAIRVKAVDYGEHESEYSPDISATTQAAKATIYYIANQDKKDPKYQRKLILADVELATILETMGYHVTLETFMTRVPSPETADKFDLVFVSSTILSSAVGGLLRGTKTPFVIPEVYMADDMGLCQDEITDSATDSIISTGIGFQRDHNGRITILDPEHPLAAGLSGTFAVCSIYTESKWIRPSDDAYKIASLEGEPDKYYITAYEKGATMYDGTPAPARMVTIGLSDYTGRYFTCEGECLFKAAITWALGHDQPECPCALISDTLSQDSSQLDSSTIYTPNGENTDNGFCGTGAGLAFIPLIIIPLRNYCRKRKRRRSTLL
jgi:hypothetical protein